MLRTLFTRRTGRALCAVSIGVATMGATVAATSSAAFAAAPAPKLTSASPNQVTTAGGQTVTLTGTTLKKSGYTTRVNFGPSTGITPQAGYTATSVKFTVPAEGTAAVESVTVVLKKGTHSYTSNAESVTDVGPDWLPPASLIIGSGSATTYDVMDHLGDLFEESPGCDLTNTNDNQYDLQCSNQLGTTSPGDTYGEAGGQAGLPVGNENPIDDYYANAPATGSGNGRSQATNAAPAGDPTNPLLGGPDGIAAFNVSFARSSSYSSNAELNYVGYATDGVSWVSEACIEAATGACANNHIGMANQTFPTGATPHWDVTDISVNNLKAIWADTFNCNLDGTSGVDGTNVTMDWRCLELAQGVQTPASLTSNGEGFGGPAEPIDCYTTQTASGTYSTWKSFLGFGQPPACASSELGDGSADTQSAADHQNLTENQMGVIDSNQGTASPGHPNDAQWAIYFFSYGKFTQTCQQVAGNTQVINPPGSTGAQIQGTCIGQNTSPPDVTQFGSIGGIYADAKTIQGNGDLTGVTFLDPRVVQRLPEHSGPQPGERRDAQLRRSWRLPVQPGYEDGDRLQLRYHLPD